MGTFLHKNQLFQSSYSAEAEDVQFPFNCCRNSAIWVEPIRQQPPDRQRE